MNNKFVLLIEDSKAIRESLIWAIQDEGYSILTASNGQEALDLLAYDPLPRLILLDMMMPVMNGFEFREKQRLNSRINTIPTVILTAKINLEKKLPLDANELILSKPFDMKELLAILRKHS